MNKITPETAESITTTIELTRFGLIKITIAAIIVFIAYRLVRRAIIKFLKPKPGTMLTERKADTLQQIFINLAKIIAGIIFTCCVLIAFGVPMGSFVAFFAILALAIGFAAQSLIKDFIAGFFFMIEGQFAIGDTVTTCDITGVVEALTFRTTSIRTMDGQLNIIPNGLIDIIATYSKEFSCAVVVVSVDYEADLDFVLETLKDEMKQYKNIESRLHGLPEVQGVIQLADSGVNIRILAKCDIDTKWEIEREILKRVKIRFDKENIVIPYNQVVIHSAR